MKRSGVIEMYAIIFWEDGDSIVKPLLNKDGSLTLFESLKEADKTAEGIPESRVISIEGVSE